MDLAVATRRSKNKTRFIDRWNINIKNVYSYTYTYYVDFTGMAWTRIVTKGFAFWAERCR